MYTIKQYPEDFIVEEIPNYVLQDGPYTLAKLTKKQITTQQAINAIAQRFHINTRHIGYAGTKDKQAVTTQYISVKGSIKPFNSADFDLEIIGTANKPISFGDHMGNKFTIVLRDVKKVPLVRNWMVNYFGEQRFSKHNVQAGIFLLKKNFKEAAALIIDKEFATQHLALQALYKVPHKIVKLYIHSVQSYIFNQLLDNHFADEYTFETSLGPLHAPLKKPTSFALPLITFDTALNDHQQAVLDQIGISQSNFVLRNLPDCTPLGGERQAMVDVGEIKIKKIDKSTYQFQFTLPPGSYATMYVAQCFLAK